MWPLWGKAKTPRGKPASGAGESPNSPRVRSLSSSLSFKDVQALAADCETPTAGGDSAAGAGRRAAAAVFHRVRSVSAALRSWKSLPPSSTGGSPDGEEKRVVIYFTSLRVVRKTFEDCRAVRSILRGLLVAVDERDLSMDSSFLSELKGILGRRPQPQQQQQLALPQVFIGGRYIGGADEVRHLHESGELRRIVDGARPAAAGDCQRCGGVRFVLCNVCHGSRKIYSDKGGGGGSVGRRGGAFRNCAACNEYGLIWCPDCSPSAAV